MKTIVQTAQLLSIKTPILLIGLFEGKKLSPLHQEINAALDDVLSQALHEQEFSGKLSETLLLHTGKRLAAQRILCVGLGQEKNYGALQVRQAIASAAELMQKKGSLPLSFISTA